MLGATHSNKPFGMMGRLHYSIGMGTQPALG